MAALDFGNGATVVDPGKPSDLYMGWALIASLICAGISAV
jgi:hypothetical protein